MGTNLEHFCLLGCWLLKLVVLGFRPRGCQTFGKSNLFMSKIVFAQVVRSEFRSTFFVVASMLCLAKPCRYLGGTPMWSEVSCCFWAPIWGLENDMLGNVHSHIRVIFWLPHVGQEPASLYERQQNQQPHISHCADIHCVEFCLEVFPRQQELCYTAKQIVGKVWVPQRVFLRKGRQFFGSNVQPRLFQIPGPIFVAVKHCTMDLC